jgi:hypothetical protein
MSLIVWIFQAFCAKLDQGINSMHQGILIGRTGN